MEDPPAFKITPNQRKSITDILNTERRIDGRRAHDTRKFQIEFSNNSTIVRLGKTLVSCTNTLTQEKPPEERPSEGRHVITISSPYYGDYAFHTEAINQIRNVIHKTRALDLESLVIKIGELIWCLKSEIVILNNDGGLIEAMNLALVTSLLSTKIQGPRGLRPLVLHHLPIAITFGIFEPHLIFTDPNVIEASVMKGSITIFGNALGELCGIYKNGGIPLRQTSINAVIEQAIEIVKIWHVEIMNQMGPNAPQMLKQIIKEEPKAPSNEENEEDVNKNDKEIIKEVTEEFKDISKEESDSEMFDDEGEEIDPGLLSFLQQ